MQVRILMFVDSKALAKVQARAFNAHDLDTLAAHYTRAARCIRDGELLGEGPDAVRDGFEAEYRTQHGHVRLVDLDGEAVLGEFTGEEGHEEPRAIIRFHSDGEGRIDEVRIDHDAALIGALRRS